MAKYNPGLFDRLLGFIIWLRYTFERLMRRKSRCLVSEDGHHFAIARDDKYLCKYCGELTERQEPGE